jgi:hypothetical protein
MTVFADVTVGQRKGYTAFSRDVQFAAARPLKAGPRLARAQARARRLRRA